MIRRFFMPYTSGAACVLGDCAAPAFPITTPQCLCDYAVGGINEIYFIPCSETMSEVNVIDLDWWQNLLDTEVLGRSGLGLGSIGKKTTKTDRVSSCRTEQLTSVTWALQFIMKCFDKTSARTTCARMNELITNFQSYLAIARMCDGEETVLPIGVFNTSDFDWTVPDNFEENQSVMLEISWKELGIPCTVDVPGLAAVVPKLS